LEQIKRHALITVVVGVQVVAQGHLADVAGAFYGLGLLLGAGASARRSMLARMAMMAITTSNSIKVNPSGGSRCNSRRERLSACKFIEM
jgi:hypothetical protein